MDPETPQTAAGWRRPRRLIAVGALVGGVALGGLGIAMAQDSPTSTTAPAQPGGGPGPEMGRFGHGPGGRGGKFGFGPMGAIHGEFVTRNGSNGFRTMDTQIGQVTAVSPDSITVKSDDGFSKTYGVDQNTLVNSSRDGIGSVKNGHAVHVTAVVDNGKANAMNVEDQTTNAAIRQHWAPPGSQGTPPSSIPAT